MITRSLRWASSHRAIHHFVKTSGFRGGRNVASVPSMRMHEACTLAIPASMSGFDSKTSGVKTMASYGMAVIDDGCFRVRTARVLRWSGSSGLRDGRVTAPTHNTLRLDRTYPCNASLVLIILMRTLAHARGLRSRSKKLDHPQDVGSERRLSPLVALTVSSINYVPYSLGLSILSKAEI
jgi:hypothetical protein